MNETNKDILGYIPSYYVFTYEIYVYVSISLSLPFPCYSYIFFSVSSLFLVSLRIPFSAYLSFLSFWCSGNVHLYSVGTRFESRQRHSILTKDFSDYPLGNASIVPRLGSDHFLPNPFQFIIYSVIHPYYAI
jgi:hypothetical protein